MRMCKWNNTNNKQTTAHIQLQNILDTLYSVYPKIGLFTNMSMQPIRGWLILDFAEVITVCFKKENRKRNKKRILHQYLYSLYIVNALMFLDVPS